MHKRGLDSWRSNSSLTHELEKVDLDSAGSYRFYSHSYTISKGKKQFYTSYLKIVPVFLASCIVRVRLHGLFLSRCSLSVTAAFDLV